MRITADKYVQPFKRTKKTKRKDEDDEVIPFINGHCFCEKTTKRFFNRFIKAANRNSGRIYFHDARKIPKNSSQAM